MLEDLNRNELNFFLPTIFTISKHYWNTKWVLTNCFNKSIIQRTYFMCEHFSFNIIWNDTNDPSVNLKNTFYDREFMEVFFVIYMRSFRFYHFVFVWMLNMCRSQVIFVINVKMIMFHVEHIQRNVYVYVNPT